MKTQYYVAASLDGYIADADDSLDWLFQFGDGPGEEYDEFIRDIGAICMGSRTYEWLLKNHIHRDPDNVQPWPYDQPSWIFSSRDLVPLDSAELHFVAGDVRPVYEEMKTAAGGKNLWVVGGGELVGQFHDAGLLDELLVHLAPVTLGAGAPLLPRGIKSPPLRLVGSTTNDEGFAILRYAIQR